MSVIIAAGAAITKAAVNTSTSKAMYSFGKAPRFPIKKNNSQANFYNLPSTRMKRFTSFGFGERSDFTGGALKKRKVKQKEENKKEQKDIDYTMFSDFDPKHPHGPRYSFALGREKFEKVYIESSKMFDKDIPGPGKYNFLKKFGYGAPSFFLKGRNDHSEVKRKFPIKPYPAANEYKNIYEINKTGRYAPSNVENINVIKMANDKSKRSNYIFNKNPGPCEYPQKQLIGKIFDSTHRSYEGFTILGRKKLVDTRSNYPGPGSYLLPSDFGQYQSKDADKYPKDNVYDVEKIKELKEKFYKDKPWRNNMKKIPPKTDRYENKIKEIIESNKQQKDSKTKDKPLEDNKEEAIYIEKEEKEDEIKN